MRRAATVAVVLATLVGCSDKPEPAASAAANFRPGADGIGDPYFPKYGNGGYDVAGYDLKLRYDPKSGRLSGTATVTATATQDLSRFDFDFANLTTTGVTVDGETAQAKQDGDEL